MVVLRLAHPHFCKNEMMEVKRMEFVMNYDDGTILSGLEKRREVECCLLKSNGNNFIEMCFAKPSIFYH